MISLLCNGTNYICHPCFFYFYHTVPFQSRRLRIGYTEFSQLTKWHEAWSPTDSQPKFYGQDRNARFLSDLRMKIQSQHKYLQFQRLKLQITNLYKIRQPVIPENKIQQTLPVFNARLWRRWERIMGTLMKGVYIARDVITFTEKLDCYRCKWHV